MRISFARFAAFAASAVFFHTTHWAPAEAKTAPQIQSFEAAGNLEQTNNIGCIPLEAVHRDYTPVDLYGRVVKCLNEKRYDDAFGLYALGGVYGRFDAQRVADKTAHQAMAVLGMSLFGDFDPKVGAQLMEAGKSATATPDALNAFCRRIAAVGSPSYYPRYMIQHGMGAYFGRSANGLIEPFDSRAAFDKAMQSYLHCELAT